MYLQRNNVSKITYREINYLTNSTSIRKTVSIINSVAECKAVRLTADFY